jgi:hypothetical protein
MSTNRTAGTKAVELIVPVRLFPDAAQQVALRDTLTLGNEAANLTSAEAYRTRATSKNAPTRRVHRLPGGPLFLAVTP